MLTFVPQEMEQPAPYQLLTSIVAPRPIAWGSTISAAGIPVVSQKVKEMVGKDCFIVTDQLPMSTPLCSSGVISRQRSSSSMYGGTADMRSPTGTWRK